MANRHDRRRQEFDLQNEDRFQVRELKWTADDLEEEKQARPDSKTKVYETNGRQDKMVFAKLESSEDEDGEDIQPISVPQRKEGQVSHHGFKQLEKSFYKKLKTVEEQVKSLNQFNRWVSKRSRSACKQPFPLECDEAASFSPSDVTEDIQKPSTPLILLGQACDVTEFVPLESSSSPTKEVGDVREMHQSIMFPEGLPSLTRAMSEILPPKSNTRDHTEESAVRQHIYPC
ncbi:uncharacterized protein LOC118797537 [Colossoma macropomum]|uniref:uncharacterized protein LOC118797537 n=1 Tax=Colossoma macropomum TaxID=42526 RepID=UPI0018640B1B|nr:uncharacterized protein LOC118797537 [Colossoma macropomum]